MFPLFSLKLGIDSKFNYLFTPFCEDKYKNFTLKNYYLDSSQSCSFYSYLKPSYRYDYNNANTFLLNNSNYQISSNNHFSQFDSFNLRDFGKGYFIPYSYNYSNSLSYRTSYVPKYDFSFINSNVNVASNSNENKEVEGVIDYSVEKLKRTWSKILKDSAFNDEFYKSVIDASKALKCDPRDLMTMMYSENGFNYNSKLGILGFCNGLDGTTMTPAEQVNAAKKYLLDSKSWSYDKNYQLSGAELYALNFVPGTVSNNIKKAKKTGADPNEMALVDKYGIYWNETNRALDYNNDGKVTTNEMAQRLEKKRAEINKIFNVQV